MTLMSKEKLLGFQKIYNKK